MNNDNVFALNGTYGDLRYDLSYVRDPRLVEAARSQYLNLNRPPLTGQVEVDEIYDGCVVGKGWPQYTSVSDIHKGQIMYYATDTSRPFFRPNFSNDGYVTLNRFKSPMDVRTNYYNFVPEPNLCNQYMNDTQTFREDILSRNQQTIKKNDFFIYPECNN